MTTNAIKNTKKKKKTNARPVVKNKSKNKKNKRKNKEEEYDFEADLRDICPEFKERAKRRLREGKPINPLWHCYERYVTRFLFGKEWTSDYY